MLVDLSVELNEITPVYPGDPETKINPAGVMDKDGYQDHYISIGTHVGTHMDAPSHMVPGGKNLDAFVPEKFTGRGVYVKVSGEFDVKEIQKIDIKEDDIVFFHTGMSEKYHTAEYFEHYPSIPEELAHWLVAKKVKMVGVDMCSVDRSPFTVHRILLGGETLIIENLTNLAALADKQFRVYAFPIKLQVDGAPVRVIAEIQ